MNTNTDWIEMSERQPITEADFVKDEWAVEVITSAGRFTQYDPRSIMGHTWYPPITHWRKVRLAPSPLPHAPGCIDFTDDRTILEKQDGMAWASFAICGRHGKEAGAFLAGRHSQREAMMPHMQKLRQAIKEVNYAAIERAFYELAAFVGLE